jgi:ATP-dependent helicase/nuclease subunit A
MGKESVGEWVLLAALCRPEADCLRPGPGTVLPAACFGPPWDIQVYPGGDYAQPAHGEVALRPAGAEGDLSALEEALAWQYPYAGCADIPSKLTATQLKGRLLDQEAAEQTPQRPSHRGLRRPAFAEERLGLTPAQRGTAQHLVMQYLNFDRTDSLEELREEIARLVSLALLTPQQGEAARPEKLLAFFRSPIGRKVKASQGLHREFKFSILVPASDFYGGCPAGEEVLLQGVVDCWLDEPEGITLIDFKTDRVTEATVADRAESYRPQLDAYRRALEEITGKKVLREVLWFFALDRAVEL